MKTLIEAARVMAGPSLPNLDDFEAMSQALKQFEAVTLPRLRALRLMHWRAAMLSRKQGEAAAFMAQNKGANAKYRAQMQATADQRNIEANAHISFVQTLNEFFPLGDTAEQDQDKGI